MVSPDDEHLPEPMIEQPPPPKRRRGGGGVVLAVLALAALGGAGGYAAILFQDRDPRLKMVAETLEDGVGRARELLGALTGEPAPLSSGKIMTRRTTAEEPKEPEAISPPSPPTADATPQLDAEAVAKAQREADEAVKRAEALAKEKAEAEAAARAQEEKSRAEAEAADKRAAQEKADQEIRAQEKAAQEKAAQEAAQHAGSAEKSAAVAAASDLTLPDQISGLEGRIDELGNEIKSLRDRLDAPKNETRAVPESVAEKPSAGPDSGAAQVVVAYTLQRQLEAGKPYGDELEALTRLGADSAMLDALKPFAAGAPTAAQLRTDFAALAKKIHAPETHPADLTEQLGKLVKVRPPGQSAPMDNSVDGVITRIDVALAHGDLIAADTALNSLPESARTETKAFGDALHGRIEADKAAESLVHSAIGALGKK